MPEAHTPPVLPPRYRLWPDADHARLGSGGAATVWRVQDQDLGVLVAMKILKDTRPGFLAKMEREAVLASRIVHPNVVAVHDIGRTPDSKGYLAFALASEGTMLELSSQVPAWPDLLDLTLQLLEAMAAMHARGILHLDVKLSNLLLHRGGNGKRQLWLADLGVARALWDEDEDKSVVGTVSYMSPERLTGQHHLWCPSTDLFAVGGVLYRLLTGRLPFPARDPSEGLTQRQRPPHTVPVRPGVLFPEGLDDVLLPMLQFDRRARYDLAADAIRAFKHLPPVDTPLGPDANPGGKPAERAHRGVPVWYRPPPVQPPHELRLPNPDRRVPQALSLLRHREISLVGRDPDLDLLWRAARAAMRTRRPLLVEVTGPRGSGRTRLLTAFTRALEEAGLGEGVSMQYAVSDGPSLGLQGAWRRIVPPGSRRDVFIREIASTLARDRTTSAENCLNDARLLASWLAPEDAHPVALNRSAIRTMMVEHLERRAWRGLVWLTIEDAHLAGENDDCWSVIDQLLQREVPALLLVDAASERVTPSLLELQARHHKSVRRISLETLTGRNAEALVQAHLPLDPRLTTLLAPRAGARPKLVKDILTHWISTGALAEQVDDNAPGRIWSLTSGVPELPPDGHALAEARLKATPLDVNRADALYAIALAGNGAPEDVIARISAEGLDNLVVDGLVDLQQGRCMFQPEELAEAVLAHMPEHARLPMHSLLAEAWFLEGDDPAVHLQVGRHRFEAAQMQMALPSLHRALVHLAPTLPVSELISLASRTRDAANVESPSSGPWFDATLALADALWRAGESGPAHNLDRQLSAASVGPDDRMKALCARIRRLIDEPARILDPILDAARALLPEVETEQRADFYATDAWVAATRLDIEGALARVLDALACRPTPVVGCRARAVRARLLSTIDPMVAWHEALRVVDTARDYGLLRYEVLAWGLAGDSMVFLGRGDEAIERLQSGVRRLEAHGEALAARSARIHLGATLMSAGRDASAREVWEANLGHSFRSHPTVGLDSRALLALLATLRNENRLVIERLPQRAPRDAASRTAWNLLLPIAELRSQLRTVHLPDLHQIQHAVALGLPGLFAAAELIAQMRESGRHTQATTLEATFMAECARLGIDPEEAKPLLERSRRSRRKDPASSPARN